MAQKKFSVNLSKLNNPSLGQFLTSSLERLKENQVSKGEDQIILTLLERLEANLPNFIHALSSTKTISMATRLKRADYLRDQDIRTFFSYLKTLNRSRNPEKLEAVANIQDKVKSFKRITALSYEKESAQIRLLLTILEKPDSLKDLQIIGAEEYLANIRQSQADFYKLFISSAKTVETVVSPAELKSLRKELQDDYHHLYQYLTVLLYMDKDNTYKTMLTSLNDIRYHYSQVQSREGKADKKGRADSEIPAEINAS